MRLCIFFQAKNPTWITWTCVPEVVELHGAHSAEVLGLCEPETPLDGEENGGVLQHGSGLVQHSTTFVELRLPMGSRFIWTSEKLFLRGSNIWIICGGGGAKFFQEYTHILG